MSQQQSSVISGRLALEGSDAGIHGMAVEVWGNPGDGIKRLGVALADQNGEYYVRLQEMSLDETKLKIRILDRDANLVGERTRFRKIADNHVQLNATLRKRDLKNHLARPLALQRPRSSLDPDIVTAMLGEAIGVIATPDQPKLMKMASQGICPGPIIDMVNTLTQDAWEVLHGTPGAHIRFLETIDMGYKRMMERPADPKLQNHSLNIAARLLEPKHSSRAQADRDHDKLPDLTAKREATNTPGRRPSMAQQVAMIAVAATSGDDLAQARRNLATIIDMFCEFDGLTRVLESAQDVLLGRSGAKGHFGRMLGMFYLECGPDDGPLLPPRGGDCSPPETPPCLESAIRGFNSQMCFGDSHYQIDEIIPETPGQPETACANSVIALRGSGFNDFPSGEVIFNLQDGSIAEGEIVSWSANEIKVRVPEGASCGLSLRIIRCTTTICGQFLDVYKSPSSESITFAGTSPEIKYVSVNNSTDSQLCLPELEEVTVNWMTCGADLTRIELFRGRNLVAAHQTDQSSGSWTYDIPSNPQTETRTYTVRINAHGHCHPTPVERTITIVQHRVPSPVVQGIEITQSIQYYRSISHLRDSQDIRPDNSMALVADKAAWVRVYIRSGQDAQFNAGQVTNVGGQLLVERIQGGSQSITLVPVNSTGTIVAEANPSYLAERRDIDSTLNFVIPAWMMRGRLRLTFTGNIPDPCAGMLSPTYTDAFDITTHQILRIAGIAVGYNGRDATDTSVIQLDAPTVVELRATAQRTYRMFPVARHYDKYTRIAGTVTQGTPLTDARTCQGCCSARWVAMNAAIANARNNDGNQPNWVYYGLLPSGIPVGPVTGCESSGVASGANGNQNTMAHEVGHNLGLQHGPCGNVGTSADPNFPAYEINPVGAYPNASIGEFGLDIADGTIFDPASTSDIMSYCNPRWVSLYHHNILLNAPNVIRVNTPAGLSAGMGLQEQAMRIQPFITMIGVVDENGEIQATSVTRAPTRANVVDGDQTDMRVELVDENDKVIATGIVYRFYHNACGCGEQIESSLREHDKQAPYAFQAFVPDVGPGRRLRIRLGDKTLWTREAPTREPLIEIDGAHIKGRLLKISCKAQSWSDYEPEYSVRWSQDGEEWFGLAVGLDSEEFELDVSSLPAGRVRFEVMLHDGFFTTNDMTDWLEIEPKAPRVSIVNPVDGATLSRSQVLYLHCLVDSSDLNIQEDGKAFTWSLDGKEVAIGDEVWLPMPKPGKHEVSVTVRDAYGEANDRVEFTMAG